MDVRQLTYFLGIVDHDGFGRAAEKLHIAQPSLSQSIRQLERELKVDLFHRVGRGVRLSEAGRQLVGPARAAVRSLETARGAVIATRDLLHGTVELVAMPSPGIEPLTTMVSAFRECHPRLTVNVQAAFTPQETVAAVHSGSAEIGILGASGRPYAADLHTLALERQPLVLISPPGVEPPGNHEAESVAAEDLRDLDVVISQRGSLMRQLVDETLAAEQSVRIVAEVAHRTSLLPMVLAGLGHTVMPASWRFLAESAGCTVRLITPEVTLDVAAVHRGEGLSPAARAFVAIATEYAARSQQDRAGGPTFDPF